MTNSTNDNVDKQPTDAQSLIDQIQSKMHKIVDEFARGEISREQFQKIYEHYQGQIVMATQLVAEAEAPDGVDLSKGETFAIRQKHMAKAKAMTVYYHATGLLLETIGDFDVSIAKISPKLNDISQAVSANREVDMESELVSDQWVLYVPGKYSTAVLLFSHEPAGRQIGIIRNMHRDFEAANDTALKSGQADGTKLVYTFQSFVRRSVGKS